MLDLGNSSVISLAAAEVRDGSRCLEMGMTSQNSGEIDRRPLLIGEAQSLHDVGLLLNEIGSPPRFASATEIELGDIPPKLVVVEARAALSMELPAGCTQASTTLIAIASEHPDAIGDRLRRLGYQYIIQRPLHEASVRSLFGNILHEGRDRRTTPRRSMGARVQIQFRNWSWPRNCSLVDLSMGGCLLVTHAPAAVNQTIKLHLDQELMQGARMILGGQVVRSRLDKSSEEWRLGVRFSESSAAQQWRLEELIGRASLRSDAALRSTPWQRLQRAINSLLNNDSESLSPTGSSPGGALDDTASQVTVLLSGYELDAEGVRLRSHPELQEGSQVLVAVHDQLRQRWIRLAADVIRDSRGAGLALLFPTLARREKEDIRSLATSLQGSNATVTVAIEGDSNPPNRRPSGS